MSVPELSKLACLGMYLDEVKSQMKVEAMDMTHKFYKESENTDNLVVEAIFLKISQ